MWGKIMTLVYRLWLHGLYGLYGPCCLVSPERLLNLITRPLSWLTKGTIKLSITGHLFWESDGNRWIPCTKDNILKKCVHIVASLWRKITLKYQMFTVLWPPGGSLLWWVAKNGGSHGGVNGPSTGRLRFGWSSIWHSSNTGSPSQQNEQTSILLGSGHFVWPSFLFWIHRIWWGCG